MKLGLVAAGLLASISVVTLVKSQDLTDTVFFTECDCKTARGNAGTSRAFPIVSSTAFDSSTLLVTETGFNCPGGDDVPLPTRSGAEFTGQGSADIFGLQGNLVGNLFFADDVQKTWTLFMNLDVSNMNIQEDIFLAESSVFSVLFEIRDKGAAQVEVDFLHKFNGNNQGLRHTVNVPASTLEDLDVVVGFSSQLSAVVVCIHDSCDSQVFAGQVGNPEGVDGVQPIPMKMMGGNRFSTPVTIHHLRFVDGENFDNADTLDAKLQDLLNKVQVLTLPPVALENKAANEEEATDINITDLFEGSLEGVEITFTNPSSEDAFVEETANEAIFKYTSKADFFGDDTVTFKYGRPAPYSCDSEDFNLKVVVANVPDTPTARSFSVPGTFAEFEKEVKDEIVALSRDNQDGGPDNLPPEQRVLKSGNIKLTPSPSGELKFGLDCGTTVEAETLVPVADGKVNICFTPSQGVKGDVPVEFVVIDGNLESQPGTITFSVENPFGVKVGNALPKGFTSIVVEDELADLKVDDLTDFKPPGENRNLDLKIVKPVSSRFGTLFKISNNEEIPLNPGDIVLAAEDIHFRPAPNVFNAIPGNTALDLAGNPVGDCSVNDRVDGKFDPDANGFCLVDFTYRSSSEVSEGIRTDSDEEGRVQFNIQAVDDKAASVVVNVDTIAATIGGTEAVGTLSGIEVQNDLGSDVFNVAVVLETLPSDSDVTMKVAGAQGNDIVTLSAAVPDVNCAVQQCTKVTITGAPSLVTQIINTVEVTLPADVSEPQVTFDIDGVGNPKSVKLDPQEPVVPGFFEDLTNVIAVSAGGGGFVVIVSGLLIVRHRRIQRARDKDELLVQADKVVPGRDAGKRREATSRAKRTNNPRGRDLEDERSAGVVSVSLEPDDELFDWEKHFDEKTQQPYFFNPKTGETSWDPPKIRGKQIRGKKDGDDEGIDPSL